jgi:UDP-N-acetylglucosamine--dolichyl-phosphate N-acetylglucosaminephosphotransferase
MNEFFFAGSFFIVSLASVFVYKKINEKKKIATGIDINKAGLPKIPEAAGVSMLLPVWAMLFLHFFLTGFDIRLFSWGIMASAFSLIGFADDLRHKFLSNAMPWLSRAGPIALVSLIYAYIIFPDFLIVVPVALFIAGIASFQNTFAGLNGWEVGSGFIISIFAAFILSETPYFIIALGFSGIILGLLFWNVFPARVFPGDSGTLLIGAGIAGLVILSQNFLLLFFSLLFFVPHAIDFFGLKLLTNPKDVSQHRKKPYSVLKNNRLGIPKGRGEKTGYDFAKLIIRLFGAMEEWKIVAIIWVIVLTNCLFWFWVFVKI